MSHRCRKAAIAVIAVAILSAAENVMPEARSAPAQRSAGGPSQPAVEPASILGVVPSIGKAGDTVKIVLSGRSWTATPAGSGKLPPAADWTVQFGRRRARVVAVGVDSIDVEVPKGLETGKTVDVSVFAAGRASAVEAAFAEEGAPQISSEPLTPLNWARRHPLYVLGAVVGVFFTALTAYQMMRSRERLTREAAEARREAERLRLRIDRAVNLPAQTSWQPSPSVGPDPGPAPVMVPDWPKELIDACASHECVLFAGGGLGAQAGYPIWNETLDRLVESAERDRSGKWGDVRDALDSGQLTLVEELLATRLPREALLEELDAIYKVPAPQLPPVWRALASIPFTNVLTPSWDPLVDRAFASDRRGRPITVTPWSIDKLPHLLDSNLFCVARLWGDLAEKRIIFTNDEYRTVLVENSLWTRYLNSLALSKSHLFIGASLETIEHYLSNLSGPTRNRVYGSASTRHYALVPDASSMSLQQERFLHRYGVQLIVFTPTPGWPEVGRAAEKLREAVAGRAQAKQELQTVTIDAVTLENIGTFKTLSVSLHAGWNALLGNNGVGKSTLLKAIALGLCGDDQKAAEFAQKLLRTGAEKGFIELQVGKEPYRTELVREGDRVRLVCHQVTPLQLGRWVVLGFPPFRGLSTGEPQGPSQESSSAPTVDDLLPLLAGPTDTRVNSLKQWIVNLDVRSDAQSGIGPEQAERSKAMRKSFFDALSEFTPGTKIGFHSVDRRSWTVQVQTEDGVHSIDQVSQGIASIIGWLGTLIERMHLIHRSTTLPEKEAAIVLIDEIDAHLHPWWQQILVNKVKTIFPQAQFVVTTHSPFIVAGLTKEEVLVLRRDETPERNVLVERPPSDLKGLRVDQILTGSSFGLGSARDPDTVKKLDRYTELSGKFPRTQEDESELCELAGKLEIEIPSPESQERARVAYGMISEALEETLGKLPKEERRILSREVKSQILEIVSGDRRPS